MSCWRGFKEGNWNREIDVRDFILRNYTPYEGDASFLRGTTKRTDSIKKSSG
jgi:formate C-acetyltransferase